MIRASLLFQVVSGGKRKASLSGLDKTDIFYKKYWRIIIKKLKLFSLIALIPFISSGLQAQSYADDVWDQLQDWHDDYTDDGYSVESYVVGKLDEDDTYSWTFWLDGGTDYTIIGVCDEDCDDIDLSIMDDDGDMVDEDFLEDDYPIVSVSPRRDGAYTIDVDMYECNVEPCFFGIAIFSD